MKSLDLQSKKVSKGTEKEITLFVYENRNELGTQQKDFYTVVRGFITREVSKPTGKRMSMAQILERSYNIDAYVLASGAASITTEYINI